MHVIDVETSPVAEAVESTIQSDTRKHILFELRGRRCCVDASSVIEVIHPLSFAPLPDPPSWLLGLAAYRGEPVAGIDPKILVEQTTPGSGGKAKTIVFRTEPNQTQFVLPIDSVHEFINLTVPPVSSNQPLTQEVVHEGTELLLIRHAQLFESFDSEKR